MKKIATIVTLVAAPALASAQVFIPVRSANDILTIFYNLINIAFPVLVSLAVIWFIIGVFNYIRNADKQEERGKAAEKIIGGIIGIFIIVSVWGLVNILRNTFSLQGKTNVDNPVLPIQ